MDIKGTSQAVYDTRYHLVWAPKYRKWILRGEVRETGKELFKEILETRNCEVEEMEIVEDHVPIFASIPPRYSIGEIEGVLRRINAKEIFQRHPEV
jgi:putative transposase